MMDLIYATFNVVAAVFVVLNALDIWRQRTVAGHTYPSAIFFAVWAVFSIPYFWNLQQWVTTFTSVMMAVANVGLLALVFRFRP